MRTFVSRCGRYLCVVIDGFETRHLLDRIEEPEPVERLGETLSAEPQPRRTWIDCMPEPGVRGSWMRASPHSTRGRRIPPHRSPDGSEHWYVAQNLNHYRHSERRYRDWMQV